MTPSSWRERGLRVLSIVLLGAMVLTAVGSLFGGMLLAGAEFLLLVAPATAPGPNPPLLTFAVEGAGAGLVVVLQAIAAHCLAAFGATLVILDLLHRRTVSSLDERYRRDIWTCESLDLNSAPRPSAVRMASGLVVQIVSGVLATALFWQLHTGAAVVAALIGLVVTMLLALPAAIKLSRLSLIPTLLQSVAGRRRGATAAFGLMVLAGVAVAR